MSTISASTTTTTAYKVTADTTGTLVLQTGSTPTTAVTIDGSQNVGVGVTPSAWSSTLKPIEIGVIGSYISGRPAGNQLDIGVNNYYNAGYKYALAGQRATQYEQANGTHSWYYAGVSTNAGDAISFTQAMTLDASGTLFINGSTNVGVNTNGGWYATPNSSQTYTMTSHVSGTSSGAPYSYFYYNNSGVGSITQNGTTGVLYNITSDYRLKNNPVPITGAKDFIMSLQPKSWDWHDGSGKGVGFIAHEFMEVAKHSGNGEKDAVDENGNPVYQTIQPSSSEVMANLVSLIQEQQALITELTNRISALENK